ncbi:Crp/Fnr family transcriptional regulator [Kaustia mangrovi]|uniref:Crp/Fnr family transcriptional regulator n=1 Tax=Kaustia mangrovi TaxID=2593653 RepID=A0A7S8HCK5_9HYPH|nr:Crp/Fnr family transcriptional regulator [Kaustia mangrovi]QPC43348.1 Crp/Fnr family transcriptional regulator [Kaustia mangrovi]
MTVKSDVEVLRQIPLFADADVTQLQILAFATERVACPAGSYLFEQGERGGAGYLVTEGTAEIFRNVGDDRMLVATAGRGAFVGELSMLAGQPYHFSARARTDLTALKVDKELFYRVAGEFPEFAEIVMKTLARKLDLSLNDLRDVERKLRDAPDLSSLDDSD